MKQQKKLKIREVQLQPLCRSHDLPFSFFFLNLNSCILEGATLPLDLIFIMIIQTPQVTNIVEMTSVAMLPFENQFLKTDLNIAFV